VGTVHETETIVASRSSFRRRRATGGGGGKWLAKAGVDPACGCLSPEILDRMPSPNFLYFSFFFKFLTNKFLKERFQKMDP